MCILLIVWRVLSLKIKFKVINIKKNLFSIVLCVFTLCIAIFCSQNLSATKKALKLWATTVVPSLLPFFMATELLKHTNVFSILGKLLDKVMKPLFNVPGVGAGALVLGIISGYPIGGKVVSDLREKKQITKIQAERLIAFTNNSGPLFILSAVGISMFSDKRIGLLLLGIHILSCLTVGIIFRFYKINDKEVLGKNVATNAVSNSNISINNLGTILRESIYSSIVNVLIIGGFITLSSVLLSILESLNLLDVFNLLLQKLFSFLNIPYELSNGTIYGIIEVTNGLNVLTNTLLKDYTFKIVLCSFLLGFGGFTVLLQVLGFTSTTDISIKPYFFGKLLQGFIASIYTYIVLKCTNLFNLTIPVFYNSNISALNSKELYLSQKLSTAWLVYPFIFLFAVFIILCFLSIGKGKGSYSIRPTSTRNRCGSNSVKIRIK